MDCVLGRESKVSTDSSDVTAEDPGGQAHGETHTGRAYKDSGSRGVERLISGKKTPKHSNTIRTQTNFNVVTRTPW